MAQLVICLQCRRLQFDYWIGQIPWRRERLPTPVFWPEEFHRLCSPWGCKESEMTERLSLSISLSFPSGSYSKESACNAGDLGSVPGLRNSSGEGNGNPLQYSCLENSMDRGAWQATVHGAQRVRQWLSDFHFFSLWSTVVNGTERTSWVGKFSYIIVSWKEGLFFSVLSLLLPWNIRHRPYVVFLLL